MTTLQSFWFGVASGIVGSLILVFFRHFFGYIASMITGIFSRNINGDWNTKFWKDGCKYEELVQVRQFMHWVWGTITYPNKGRSYEFSGTIYNNLLVASYEVKGWHLRRSTIDRGAFTLALNSTGTPDKLTGKYAWTDDKSNSPEADNYEWEKIKK